MDGNDTICLKISFIGNSITRKTGGRIKHQMTLKTIGGGIPVIISISLLSRPMPEKVDMVGLDINHTMAWRGV